MCAQTHEYASRIWLLYEWEVKTNVVLFPWQHNNAANIGFPAAFYHIHSYLLKALAVVVVVVVIRSIQINSGRNHVVAVLCTQRFA